MTEAMRQVLDAWQTAVYGSDSHHKAMLLAITNMVKAIDQAQKQEPVGYWGGEFSKDGGAVLYEMPQNEVFMVHPNIPLYAHPAQPEQEPVMWVYRYTREDGSTYLSHVLVDERNPVEAPLYTAPPKPEWVGLTDDDIESIIYGMIDCKESGVTGIARLVEKVLKEKNHG